MEKNVGSSDQKLRIALGALAGALSLGTLFGSIALPTLASPLLGVVAIIMLGTAVTGSCPAYALLGVDTCSRASGTDRKMTSEQSGR